jgi:WD40 repeat protein
MNADLTGRIVRILRSDKETAGTGFVVADGLVVTCAHVIASASQPKEGRAGEDVKLVFRANGQVALAEVVADWWRPSDGGDVAFLRLKEPLPVGVSPPPLGSSRGTGNHAFQTFGFPSASPEEGIWGDGHILAETLIQGMRMLQLSSSQITSGFSGAPVFDTVNRRVVGMVTAIASQDAHGRMAETAFITPTETLRMICLQLVLSDVQPYLGLAAFGEADAEFFFGRRREVERLLASLGHEPRFLAVLGPSGSGKSSIVQASLIPQLRRGGVPGSDSWGIITARPGDRPQENLEARGLDGAGKGLAEAARSWLAKSPDNTRLVLVLDQFEELLATVSSEKRQDFLEQLGELLEADLPITLLLIMRDDFFSRLAKEAPPSLFEWVQRGFVHISAGLDESELKEIIEGPAGKVGLQFEEGLAEVVVKDVLVGGERAGRSTILPLLEFALTELWRRRKEGYLTHEAYSAIGGVTGSLTQWADQAYQSLCNEGLGEMARRVLTELVNLGDERQGIPDSRRRRTLEDFGNDAAGMEAARKVVMRLADARLVTTSFDQQNKQETVEIIHDSLIREWGRLRQWLREDRSFLAWDRELEKKAAAWEEGKRDEGRLLRGLDLSEAESWRENRGRDLGEAEERLIAASLSLQERERREKEQRRKRIILGLAAFSALALVLAGAAFWQWNLSEQKTGEALGLYLASQSMPIEPTSESDWMKKVLLAVESLRQKETAQGDLALRESIALLGVPLSELNHNDSVSSVDFSPDGKKIATASFDRTARIWDVQSGKELHKLTHEDTVYIMAFSPDGKKLATASVDRTARIWDVQSGQELHKLTHEEQVWSVTFSPDGMKVATASDDKTARIWDVQSGQELHRLTHEGHVNSAAFSPDGMKVATTSDDGTVRIWDVQSGQELHRLTHENQVLSVAFSPDGKKIATAAFDTAAIIWDVQSGQELHKLPQYGSTGHVAFSPDGQKVATTSVGNASIWDVQSGQELHKLPYPNNGMMDFVAFSPDGKKVATAGFETTAFIWDVQSGQELQKLPQCGSVNYVAFSPDGMKVATASHDNTARIWDVQCDQEHHKLIHGNKVSYIAFSPDGKKVVTACDDNNVSIWDVQSGQELHKLPQEGWVNSVVFSPDGKKVVTACNDNAARIWDVQSGQELYKLIHEGWVTSVAFSPDGKKIATASHDNTARIWDVQSGQELQELHHDDDVNCVAFSPNGKSVATDSGDNASIWDVQSGQELHRLPHKDGVRAVVFSPDGMKVATANFDNASIWDVQSGQKLHELTHKNGVDSMAFSPDGKKFATVGGDETTRIWDVQNGQELHKLVHPGVVYSVAFSLDGKKIATASGDLARIWDVQSGQELQEIPHEGWVNSVAFSPDGKKIATASDDGTARIWPVSAEDLIKEACNRITTNLTAGEWEIILRESDCKTCPREWRFNRSNDFLGDIKNSLKRAQRLLQPSSDSGAIPGECQPCIADGLSKKMPH